MTIAICLRCGAFKHGAFTWCHNCGYTPDDDESLTKHLLVTDHFYSTDELNQIAARIKSGETIEFDQATLQAAWVNKAELDADMKRISRILAIGCGVVVSLGLIVPWLAWLLGQ